MDQISESSDDSEGPLWRGSSAPKALKQGKEEAAKRPENSNDRQNRSTSNAAEEYLHTKEKRLMRKRRKTLKRRKFLSRRGLSNSEDEVLPPSKRLNPHHQSKARKKRRGSRKVKHKPSSSAEEQQDVSLPRDQVVKSTLLDSRDQDQPDATKCVEVVPSPKDSIKQKRLFRSKGELPSILRGPAKGVSINEVIRMPSYQKQAQNDSASTEARLLSARLLHQDADTGHEISQPAYTDRLEADDANVDRSLSLENAEPTSEEANTNGDGHRRIALLSPALLSGSMRDLGNSFLQSNPLVSLMRRASRFTLTLSMSESRLSHSSKPPDDEEGGHATAKSSTWRPTVASTTDRAYLEGGHARVFCSPLTVVGALVAVTLLAGFLVLFATKRGGDHAPKAFEGGRPSRLQLERLCSIVACRRGVHALVDSLLEWDNSSSCAQFGQYVCGGWNKHSTRRRSSFNDEALEQSMERLHMAMMQMSNARSELADGTDEPNMALFYKSCLGFLMHEQVTRASDVLKALNVSANGLRLVETQRSLFQFVVVTTLRTGLPSVVSVVLRGSKLVLDAGRSLELALLHAHVEQYLRETLKELRSDGDENLIPALLAIDTSATSWLKKVKESDPLVTRRLGDLNTPFANATWTGALNALPAKFPAFTASSYVHIRDEPLLYAALSTMSRVDLERARLYAIVLLLAQVIRYRYVLGGSSRTLTYECLSTTGSHFPTVFLPWSYSTLVERNAQRKLRQMVDIMKESFRTEVGLYGAGLGHWSITVLGESKESFNKAARTATPSVRGKPAPYDEAAFLANVVRARAESVGQEWEDDGDVDRQLQGSLQFKPSSPSPNREAGHVITMSAALLADPFFIGDPALPELDYGTVGVRLLVQWLHAELRSNTPMRDMIANFSPPCPPDDVGKDPIFDIAGEGKQTANQTSYANLADFTTELALRTALAASRAIRLQPQRNSAASSSETAEREGRREEAWLLRDRVFFWRFCHSLCGDASQAGLCDHVMRRVPGFEKVFACDSAETTCVAAAGAVRLDETFYLS